MQNLGALTVQRSKKRERGLTKNGKNGGEFMRRVIVESPYAGNFLQRWLNRRYARAALHDCLRRGEAPFASHLLYTQPGVLRDGITNERDLGIRAGFVWGELADCVAVYMDRGVSSGMQKGIDAATRASRPVEYRWLTGKSLQFLGGGGA